VRKTTMQIAIIALGLVCVDTATATTYKDRGMELLMTSDQIVFTDHGCLAKKSRLKTRLETFFVKHKVQRPVYYARLLSEESMTDQERKLFAAILILETRGRAHLVSSEGAVGPWQQHPCWFKRFGRAREPKKNLRACLNIYRIHRSEEKTFNRALLAYSGGSRWYPEKIRRLVAEI